MTNAQLHKSEHLQQAWERLDQAIGRLDGAVGRRAAQAKELKSRNAALDDVREEASRRLEKVIVRLKDALEE